MAIVLRILAAMVAYGLACLTASLVITLGMLAPRWDDWSSPELPPAALWAIIIGGTPIIAAIAFLPSLLVIVLAEAFAWRSSLVYAALGGVLAVALCGLDFTGYVGGLDAGGGRERAVVAAAGIAGGFVYWLVAGRKAGSWKS